MREGGSEEAFVIARSPAPLLLVVLLSLARDGVADPLPVDMSPLSPGVMLAARPPLEGVRQRERASEERTQSRRAARGLDSVRIVRAWKVLTASGPTGMVLDVYNGGRWLVTGLVVELDDVDGETRKPTHHTCQMGVVIPAGRVARVSCYKAIIDPERVEPRIVGVHWR